MVGKITIETMNDIHKRIADSFNAQGLMATIGARLNLLRPALGERFLAIGRVQSAGKLLTVSTGEVRAFSGTGDEYKVVALMQATIVNVRR
jgi:acyl-coenzyme A thioesterase PaaI-like protein